MSIKEYRDILNEEIKNENEIESNIRILKAKQELLNDEENKVNNFELLNSLEGYTLIDQIKMLDNYLNQNNSINNIKTYNYKNPNVLKQFNDNKDGYTNIILLSISLIIIAIIIIAVIFA